MEDGGERPGLPGVAPHGVTPHFVAVKDSKVTDLSVVVRGIGQASSPLRTPRALWRALLPSSSQAGAWLSRDLGSCMEDGGEWPGLPGDPSNVTPPPVAVEDTDISVVLRGIGILPPAIDKALEDVRASVAGTDPPFTFNLRHMAKLVRACNLQKGQWELKGRIVAAVLALVGHNAPMRKLAVALSDVISLDLTYTGIGVFNDHLDLDEASAASLCANLGHHSNVRYVRLEYQKVFGTEKGCELLAQALRRNKPLEELYLPDTGMGSGAFKLLVSGLKDNHTLKRLDVGFNELIGDEGAGYVAELLADNTRTSSLRFLQLHCIGMGLRGAMDLTAALARNTSLHTITLGANRIGQQGTTTLLQLLTPGPTSPDASAPSTDAPGSLQNTTLRTVGFGNLLDSEFSVEFMALMIKRNTSLARLELEKSPLSPGAWVEHIIPALRENTTLKELILTGSMGVTPTSVLDALIDLVRSSNTALELIDVEDTPLSRAGLDGRLAEELRINNEYRSRFKGQPTRTPVCGRLVLCGYEFAGKTTICKTLRRIVSDTLNCHGGRMAFKNFFRRHPGLRQCLYGEQASRELEHRTRGYEVVVLRKESRRRTTIWDFAGQKEYYVLHDFMLPTARNTCFLFVCSAVYHVPHQLAGKPKTQVDMEKESVYWLRFLASNAKPSSPPLVIFVLTNKDVLGTMSAQHTSTGRANNVVAKMKEMFGNVIDLEDRARGVNAQSSTDIKGLLELVENRLGELLGRGDKEFVVCDDVRLALQEWAAGHPSNPIIRMEKFRSLCHEQVTRAMDGLVVGADGRNPVLAYLNDVGDIICPGTLDFIVVNPTWFGRGVLGSTIDTFRRTREPGEGIKSKGLIGCVKDCLPGGNDVMRGLNHENGFVYYRDLEDLLETSLRTMHLKQIIAPQDLIALMIELEMCFPENPEEEKSRQFIPAVFDDDDELAARGNRKPKWMLGQRDGPFQHVGRRLQCANSALTFLSPGFFPRLQVVLRNYYDSKGWINNPAFQVDRNLIGFAQDGHEIITEYSGDIDCFVDILAKSSQTYSRTLHFVREQVMKKIVEFCASPQGCQGVVLVDAVIRPICVEQLHICADRMDNAVLVSLLENNLAEDRDEKACRHTWRKQIQGTQIDDYALDLLEGKGSFNNFKARRMGLQVHLEHLGTRRHIFVTRADVEWPRKVLAIVRYGRVVPFRFHIKCECRNNEHSVDQQDGRIFYVVDKAFDTEQGIRQVAGKAASSALMGGGSVVPGLGAAASLPGYLHDGTPVYCDTIESLSTQFGQAEGTISDEQLRGQVEENMQNSRAGPWMAAFLNFGPGAAEIRKFRKDFLLWEVEYLASASTNSTAWMCERHCREGVEEGTFRRII